MGGKKILWVKKIGSKRFLGQKRFWVKKKFGSKRFVSEIIFAWKKTCRVNPMGRIYDPPPQKKIVGLKLCWVVVSFSEVAYKISDP